MYITLTKKRLFIILCFSVIILLGLAQFFSVKAERINLNTNAERVEYIESLGITLINDQYKAKTVAIPNEFNEVYKKYNKLQKESDFDLTDFKGKQVTVYTYNSSNEQNVNLMVYKNQLIGGDISDSKLNGSMNGLKGENNGKRTAG